VTVGERLREIYEQHDDERAGDRCGCVCCRAFQGESHPYAHVVAAMILGATFEGIRHREHDNQLWRGIWSGDLDSVKMPDTTPQPGNRSVPS